MLRTRTSVFSKTRLLTSTISRSAIQRRYQTTQVEKDQPSSSDEPVPTPSVKPDFNDTLLSYRSLSQAQVEEIINSIPKPTLNRDEILNEKFEELFSSYIKAVEKSELETGNLKVDSSAGSLLKTFPNLTRSDKESGYTDHELFVRRKYHEQKFGNLGSKVVDVYRPHDDIAKPPTPSELTLKKLMSSGAHLGHSVKLYKHSAQPFIYGKYKDIHIIDLEKTMTYLKRASKVVEGVAENGGIIVFVGGKHGQLKAVKEAAKRSNGYYITDKWIPGTITNGLTQGRLLKEVDMGDVATGRKLSMAELETLIKPDLFIILNPLESQIVLKEANLARIPTIGIVDTNVDPACVTYPIPANDDSVRATNLICSVLARAGQAGREKRLSEVSQYKVNLGMMPTSPIILKEDQVADEREEDDGWNDVNEYDNRREFNNYKSKKSSSLSSSSSSSSSTTNSTEVGKEEQNDFEDIHNDDDFNIRE